MSGSDSITPELRARAIELIERYNRYCQSEGEHPMTLPVLIRWTAFQLAKLQLECERRNEDANPEGESQ